MSLSQICARLDDIIKNIQHIFRQLIINFIHLLVVEEDFADEAKEITNLGCFWNEGKSFSNDLPEKLNRVM